MYGGAGLARDAVFGLFQQSDERGAAGLGLGKRHGGLHLRQHRAGGKLPLVHVTARQLRRQVGEPLLIFLAEVDGDLLHGGQDDEHIRVEQLGKLCRGKVLVDNGGCAVELSVLADDGDAAAADGDDDGTGVHERLHGVLFNDVDGLGRGNDLTVAAACVLDHGVALFLCDAFCRFLVVERADGLRRLLEGGIVLRDEHLRDDGRHILVHPARGKLVADGVLEVVADVALAHGAALRERHVGLDGAGLCGGGHTEIDHADLRAVAVRNDDLVAFGDQIDDGLRGLAHQRELLSRRIAQGVAAESDHNSFTHNQNPLLLQWREHRSRHILIRTSSALEHLPLVVGSVEIHQRVDGVLDLRKEDHSSDDVRLVGGLLVQRHQIAVEHGVVDLALGAAEAGDVGGQAVQIQGLAVLRQLHHFFGAGPVLMLGVLRQQLLFQLVDALLVALHIQLGALFHRLERRPGLRINDIGVLEGLGHGVGLVELGAVLLAVLDGRSLRPRGTRRILPDGPA